MKTTLLTLGRILFYRPLITALLLVVYSVGALLFMTSDSPQKNMAIIIISGISTAFLSALLTERISRHAIEAGLLGLPDNARILRRVQACFLLLFALLPAALAMIAGVNCLVASAAMATAAAGGIAFVTYGGGLWFIPAMIVVQRTPLEAWAQIPAVQAAALGLSGLIIWRWFDLPAKAERKGPSVLRLADAKHERRAPWDAPTDSTADDGGAEFDALAGRLESGQGISDALAPGFGYSLGTAARDQLRSAGIALAALAIWRLMHGSRPAALAYYIVTAFCCLTLMGRLQGLMRRWMATSAEQSLLLLAPRWPTAHRIKLAIVWTTLRVQRASITVWIVASCVAALLGSINGTGFLLGSVAMGGTSLAFSGAVWAVLARRRIRAWHFSTVAIILIVLAGAMAILLAAATSRRHSWMIGALLMLIPPAAALAAYLLAPLRFPLNVDARAIQAT